MSNFNDRNTWNYRAKQALEEFGARGIDLPKPVLEAVQVLERVEASKPSAPAQTAIRSAIVAGAPQDEIDRLILADLGATRLSSEWTQARTDSAGAVLAAIRAAEPTLQPALAKLADAAIGKLAQVAALGNVKLDALIRAGRQSDAALLADAETTAAELTALFRLRDEFLVVGGGRALTVNGVNCSVWRDPDAAAQYSKGSRPVDQYLSGLSANVPLWFPSGSDAIEAATVIAAKRADLAERKRQQDHGAGSLTYMSP